MSQMEVLTIEEIQPTDERGLASFHGALRSLFKDDNDTWSRDGLRRYAAQQARYGVQVEYLLSRVGGEVCGMFWSCCDPDRRVAYVPYFGVLPRFQHTGVAQRMDEAVRGHLMQRFGTAVQLGDCQDPARFAGREVWDRVRYLQRAGNVIIDDPDFPYVRPGSGEAAWHEREDTYLLGIRLLDASGAGTCDSGLGELAQRGQLSLRSYRALYLQLMRLDIGGHDEADLRARAPAIREFLDRVDAGLAQDPERRVRLLPALAALPR
jgi:hypothetical protein